MSVLVKGMEMPEKCANCPICVAMPLGDYVVYHKCALLNLLASKRGRRNDCPLIPIPPHGRLIDADALKRMDFTKVVKKDGETYVPFMEVAEAVFNAPTIIEAEAEE